ncbi:MAG: flagellar filament capping protein FliD [Lachnospiraceae bacterium]|nr:flagellar filament capping protein FliD [Lachnospiraceae bacterium]
MPIRLTGMSSGLDTEALVSELVSAYRTKEQKYEKAQTKLSWKMDAWKTMNSKTYSFYNNISSLRFSSAYSLKKTTVSNAAKVSVTSGNSAVNGTQTLNITNLAKSGYLTGDVLSPAKNKAGSSTTLGELTYANEANKTSEGKATIESFSGKGTISVNGKEIELESTTTIQEVVGKLKDAGVNASFDEMNQRIFVSSEKSGESADFSMIALDANGAMALKSLGLYTSSEKGNTNYKLYSKLDEEYVKENKNNAYADRKNWLAQKLTAYNKNKADLAQATANEEMYQKAIVLKEAVDTIQSVSGGNTTKQMLMDDESRFVSEGTVYDKKTDVDGSEYYVDSKNPDGVRYYVNLSEPADANKKDASELKDLKTADEYLTEQGISEEDRNRYREASKVAAVYESDDSIRADLRSEIMKDPNLTIQDLKNRSDAITADKKKYQKDVDEAAYLEPFIDDYVKADNQDNYINKLDAQIEFAMKATTGADPSGIGYNSGAVRINGEDAEIYLNGALFTSDSNTFSINGLTINATGTTIDKNDIKDATKAAEAAITITTTTDSQGVYDKIKDFISEYNSLINDMTKSYNAANAKDYEPLTDDEKDAMTDSQVEKWEQKIKDSLLRRDTTLGGVMSAMTSIMSRSYTINGKNYALSSFGIKTLGYGKAEKNEENAYHIDGDSDDDTVSGNADKLLAAINEDPDAVMQFFQQLTQDLYSTLGNKMTATSLSSTQTIYNDKEMAKEYSDYTTTISKWEDKVAKIEDSYYKKFSAMEKSLAELQSKTSQLSGLLGS